MSTAPYLPLYLKDWLIDTRGFTHEDKGVLVDLLLVAWDRGGIPSSSEAVRKLAVCTPAEWRRIWPTVQAHWIERDGVLIYPKLEAARLHVEKRSASARAKAEKRWSADADDDAAALPQHCHSNAEPACSGNAQQTTNNKQLTTNNSTSRASAREDAPSPSGLDAAVHTALRFPTVGREPTWALTESQLATWVELFPSLDVRGECRSALAWILAHPQRRKTVRGMPGFLASWLGRSNDRARASPALLGPMTRGERAVQVTTDGVAEFVAGLAHGRTDAREIPNGTSRDGGADRRLGLVVRGESA